MLIKKRQINIYLMPTGIDKLNFPGMVPAKLLESYWKLHFSLQQKTSFFDKSSYKLHLNTLTPFTPGFAIKTSPLLGYFFNWSSVKFSLAVVMISWSKSSPANAQEETLGAGTSMVSICLPLKGFHSFFIYCHAVGSAHAGRNFNNISFRSWWLKVVHHKYKTALPALGYQ